MPQCHLLRGNALHWDQVSGTNGLGVQVELTVWRGWHDMGDALGHVSHVIARFGNTDDVVTALGKALEKRST